MVIKYKRHGKTQVTKRHIMNEWIRFPQLRVIGADGENIGVLSTQEALRMAREKELDLVVISEKADPPVAKILEISKFLYDERKKQSAAKAKSKKSETKEFIFGPAIGDGDLQQKIDRAREFLTEGNKVKVTLKFKGRQVIYPEVGLGKVNKMIKDLEEIARPEENDLKLRGNIVTVTFVKK